MREIDSFKISFRTIETVKTYFNGNNKERYMFLKKYKNLINFITEFRYELNYINSNILIIQLSSIYIITFILN